MTDQPQETMDDEQRSRERDTDVLEQEQEHKGYGRTKGSGTSRFRRTNLVGCSGARSASSSRF